MKRFVIIAILFCFSLSKIFAQADMEVQKAKLQALKKQAEALKGLDRKAFTNNRDSAMSIYRKAMKGADSIKNAIMHDALKTVPQGALAERYLNTKTFSDTTYTTVQFSGRIDQTNKRSGDFTHITANCTAESAPLVQHGSSFTVMLMSNEQMDFQAHGLSGNKKPSHLVKYIVQQNKMESHASFNSFAQTKNTRTTTTTMPANGKAKQFLFTFDTLTNIGHVSYLEVLNATTVTEGGDSTGTRNHETTAGVAAVTDPKTYKFSEWGKDESMNNLDKLTEGKLLKIDASDDGEAKAVLLVEKTKTGFKLTCHSNITKGDETTNLNIIAYIGRPITEYEAVIKPVEEGDFKYEKWLPKGPKVDGSDDEKPGDSIQFYVEVRSKKEPTKIYNGNYTVEWQLKDVTKYPGICNNYPAYTESPDLRSDLRFDPKLMNDIDYNSFLTDGETATTIENKGKYVFVKVISRDYAAWGKLKATITLDDGSFPLTAQPYYDNNLTYITIPYDKDENKLADQWEKDNNVFKSGHPLTWDEDSKPEKQKDNGDGYTLFEEYRGFAVHKPNETAADKQDVFVRTDPDQKDVFIYDRDKLFQDYYEADNPAEVTWHYVVPNKHQFINKEPDIKDPLHRIINFNKVDEYTYTSQFCIALYNETHISYDAGCVGLTWGKLEYDYTSMFSMLTHDHKQQNHDKPPEQQEAANADLKEKLKKEWDRLKKIYESSGDSPLKSYIKCSIYPLVMAEKYNASNYPNDYIKIRKALLKSTVIHEIGHNLGMHHHEGVKNPFDSPGATEDLFDNAEGVLNCAIRYPSPLETKDITALTTIYNHYCRKNDPAVVWTYTYDVDASGKRVDKNAKGQFLLPNAAIPAPKPSDNCFGQITLKAKHK